MVTSDVLREMPGIRLVRTRTGRGIRFASASSRRGDCLPMIWIDGQRAEGLEVDDIPLSDIEGIELYNAARGLRQLCLADTGDHGSAITARAEYLERVCHFVRSTLSAHVHE